MSKRTIIELPEGKKLYFGGDAKGGLSEVSARGNIARVTTEQFKSALGSLGELVKILEESVGTMTKYPDKVEMEFGASLKGECDLWSQALVGEELFRHRVLRRPRFSKSSKISHGQKAFSKKHGAKT